MRIANRVVLCVLVLVVATCASACHAEELRGAWVTAWTSGFFTPEEVDATVAAAKSAGLNALFIQVRKNADAYYKSETEPLGSGIAPDFDPLACVIRKAHAEGIQVHAWMNSGRIWSPKEPPSDPKHVANRHPEWINKDVKGNTRAGEGLYLDLGVPEAREYVASVAEEIARKYDVDGIHLDYIRYPGKDWGYSAAALSRYYSDAGTTKKPDPGDPKWMQWKRDQVTDLVRRVRKKVLAARPGTFISASTIPWGDCPSEWTATTPYSLVAQDWRRWMAEGILDANCPMNYKVEKNPKNARQFRDWLAGFARWSSGRPTYVGIEVYLNEPEYVIRQIEAIRKAGLQGFMLFSFNQSSRRAALVKALGSGPAGGASVSTAQEAFERGIKYAVANQLGMAKVSLQRAIELDPNYAEAYFRLGRCYLREKNDSKASEFFRKVLSLDPNHAGAKSELKSLEETGGSAR